MGGLSKSSSTPVDLSCSLSIRSSIALEASANCCMFRGDHCSEDNDVFLGVGTKIVFGSSGIGHIVLLPVVA